MQTQLVFFTHPRSSLSIKKVEVGCRSVPGPSVFVVLQWTQTSDGDGIIELIVERKGE